MNISSRFCPCKNNRGFGLLGLVVAMMLATLLAGGGLVVLRASAGHDLRQRSPDYLDEVRRSLFIYVKVNGRLPSADVNGDGAPDGVAAGRLPYTVLGVRPGDDWHRQLRYEVNAGLLTDRQTTCNTLNTPPIPWQPLVWDEDAGFDAVGKSQPPPPTNPFPVAAVLASGGPRDADGGGGEYAVFDAISLKGDNASGSPAYVRSAPEPTFDDLVAYIGTKDKTYTGANTLLAWLIVNDTAYSWTTCP